MKGLRIPNFREPGLINGSPFQVCLKSPKRCMTIFRPSSQLQVQSKYWVAINGFWQIEWIPCGYRHDSPLVQGIGTLFVETKLSAYGTWSRCFRCGCPFLHGLQKKPTGNHPFGERGTKNEASIHIYIYIYTYTYMYGKTPKFCKVASP